MRLPAKVEYGVLALLTLAAQCGDGERLQLRRLADDHDIPHRFLVQIMLELKRAGIVASVRGAGGGYRLTRPPHDISLGEVVAAIEGTAPAVMPRPDELYPPLQQVLDEAWQGAVQAHQDYLNKLSLLDLVELAASRREPMWYI
jgi:Rrf2 family protein